MSYRFKGVIKRVEVSEEKMKVYFDYSYKLKDLVEVVDDKKDDYGVAMDFDKDKDKGENKDDIDELYKISVWVIGKNQEFIVEDYCLKQIILDNIHKEVEVGFDLDNNAGENSEEDKDDKDSMNDKSYRITDIVIF